MKHHTRLLIAVLVPLAGGLLSVAPTSPATSAVTHPWTREDPSFPFRWNPCQPITYRVDLAGTPRRNLRVLRSALHDVSAASGFRFVYAGHTAAVPYAKGRTTLDQVPADGLTVAWATPQRVPDLAGHVVGLGGPGASSRRVGADWEIESAGVVIDKTAVLPATAVKGPNLKSLLLHELGHAMGLGHSRSKADVMYPALGPWSRPRLGPGDKAGLHALGVSHSCS